MTPARVLLVASSGGHLAQLQALKGWYGRFERMFVTFDTPDARARLVGERRAFAAHPTQQSARALARNLVLARRVFRGFRPDLLVSTGAGVAVPFFWLAARHGARSVFVEVFDCVDGPSLTGRLVAPFADEIALQRPEQQAFYPRGRLLGPTL